MRKWLIKQMERFGFDSSNLKTETERNGYFLKLGESHQIIFPENLLNHGDVRIKEWFFKKGQLIQPGDVIVCIEDEKHSFELESFVGGKLIYFLWPGQKVEVGSILGEIRGVREQ